MGGCLSAPETPKQGDRGSPVAEGSVPLTTSQLLRNASDCLEAANEEFDEVNARHGLGYGPVFPSSSSSFSSSLEQELSRLSV